MLKTRKFIARSPWLIFTVLASFLWASCSTTNDVQNIDLENFSSEDYVRGIFFAQGQVAELIPEIAGNYDLDFFVNDPDAKALLLELQEGIIQQLVDDGSLVGLKEKLESGNHFIIAEALQDIGNDMHGLLEENQADMMAAITANSEELFEVIGRKFDFSTVTQEEMDLALKDREFMLEVSNAMAGNSAGREEIVDEQECIAGAAVAAVAAIVGAVAYVLFVLEAVAFWTDVGVDWGDGPAVGIDAFAARKDLLKEQMVNSIAERLAR